MKLNKLHLVIAVLCLVCVGILVYRAGSTSNCNQAEIVSDGKTIDTIDLSKVTEPYEIEVNNELGYNKISVEPGRIAVVEADCPDKLCVNQGYIGSGGLPIVCLPHMLTITMTDSGEIDAVAGR